MSASVFPAYVGMSPVTALSPAGGVCVPRIRGDEPLRTLVLLPGGLCSPHTWG